MGTVHSVQSLHSDDDYLYLQVEGKSYRIRWAKCSRRLAQATPDQRRHLEVSPSGYGIHWPEIDEDLAITPMLQEAELLVLQPSH